MTEPMLSSSTLIVTSITGSIRTVSLRPALSFRVFWTAERAADDNAAGVVFGKTCFAGSKVILMSAECTGYACAGPRASAAETPV